MPVAHRWKRNGVRSSELLERARAEGAHILQKLSLRDRVQAVVLANETELVVPGSTERDEPATS